MIKEENNSNESNFDFITGGAKIDEKIDPNFKKTFNTQVCNCGMFKSSISKASINICDNCVFARAPKENTTTTYCTKQKNETSTT